MDFPACFNQTRGGNVFAEYITSYVSIWVSGIAPPFRWADADHPTRGSQRACAMSASSRRSARSAGRLSSQRAYVVRGGGIDQREAHLVLGYAHGNPFESARGPGCHRANGA